MRPNLPLAGILLLAAVLRFYGLDWGIASLKDYRIDGRHISFAESGFHPDSNALELATASLDDSLYPTIEREGQTYLFSSYGTLFMYIFWAVGKLSGELLGFDAFSTDSAGDADATRLVGRAISASYALATVWLVYLLGRRCFGTRSGELSALLLALTPMSIQAAHMATVDGLLGLLAVWLCLCSVKICRAGSLYTYLWSGVVLGLAVATKINGALLVFAPVIAHLLVSMRSSRINSKLRAIFLRPGLYVTAASALGTYMVLTPAALFRSRDYFLTEFYGNIFHVFEMNIGGDFVQKGSVYLEGTSYLYLLTDVFPAGLGWPLFLVSVLGILYAFTQRKPEDLIVVGTLLICCLLLGRLLDKPIRYYVLLGPMFALLSARLIGAAISRTQGRLRIGTIGGTICLSGWTGLNALAFVTIYAIPDSRVEAANWVHTHLPPGSTILVERGHNDFSSLLSEKEYRRITMNIEQEAYKTWNDSLARNGDYAAIWEMEYLDRADCLLISDDRMALARSNASAEQYYRLLFEGKLPMRLVESYEMIPEFLSWTFDDTKLDLNSRRYDHPSTFVFRRSKGYSIFSGRPDLERYRMRTRKDCLDLFDDAMKLKDYLLFRHCLTRKLRASLSSSLQWRLFLQFLRQPDLRQDLEDPFALVLEDGIWRINVTAEFR